MGQAESETITMDNEGVIMISGAMGTETDPDNDIIRRFILEFKTLKVPKKLSYRIEQTRKDVGSQDVVISRFSSMTVGTAKITETTTVENIIDGPARLYTPRGFVCFNGITPVHITIDKPNLLKQQSLIAETIYSVINIVTAKKSDSIIEKLQDVGRKAIKSEPTLLALIHQGSEILRGISRELLLLLCSMLSGTTNTRVKLSKVPGTVGPNVKVQKMLQGAVKNAGKVRGQSDPIDPALGQKAVDTVTKAWERKRSRVTSKITTPKSPISTNPITPSMANPVVPLIDLESMFDIEKK